MPYAYPVVISPWSSMRFQISSFNQFSRSDTAVQFPDVQSLSALALSAAFKLLLADALLFNLPSQ